VAVLTHLHVRDGDAIEREDEIGFGLRRAREGERRGREADALPQEVLLDQGLDRQVRVGADCRLEGFAGLRGCALGGGGPVGILDVANHARQRLR
jgi:hypothetical protein